MINASQSKHYIPGLNYYKQTQFVSNSEIGKFMNWLQGKYGISYASASFGNLLDALMTEEELVSHENRTVCMADGVYAEFSEEDFSRAMLMRETAYKDPTISLIMKNMDFQYEKYIDCFEIEHSGRTFSLPFRIKMDGNARRIRTGMDLKSTIATTQKQFEESILHFNYDRQSSVYMDVEELDRFWFVGVGKKPLKNGTHPVFKKAVKRGDEFYQAGRAKYQYWCDLYDALIHNLNINLM